MIAMVQLGFFSSFAGLSGELLKSSELTLAKYTQTTKKHKAQNCRAFDASLWPAKKRD